VDWALEHTERWYGEKMERPSRQRARVIAAARTGDPGARGPLLALLNTETNVYWQAVAAGLLGHWVDDSAVAAALRACLGHPHPLVRERAARALEPRATERDNAAALAARLEDPARAVRLAAAWALRDRLDLDSRAGRELRHLLDLHADQPTGQMQRGALALERGDLDAALAAYARAVAWDPNSAPIRHDYAVALSRAGRAREALEQLQTACRLAPREAEYAFKLGLAWNELGQLPEAAAALERAVQLDPRHARAAYNLGLARDALGRPAEAESALAAAEAANPADPRIPFARATVLARLGRFEEARAAAARALALGHEPEAVRALLRALER
jgi:tetratricopeptide (TPR) repeat protein